MRKSLFLEETKTKKMIVNTFIANEDIIENEHSLEVVDAFVHVKVLM